MRMNKCKFSTADKWFSYFVRLRDVQWGGYGQCRTCGAVDHWKSMDCGHFQTRDRPMTRFDERNCHLQCKHCNWGKKGEQYKMSVYIDNVYGAGTADLLENLAGIRGQKIHGKLALKDIAKEYRLKAKDMAREKGVEL